MTSEEAFWAGLGPEDFRDDETRTTAQPADEREYPCGECRDGVLYLKRFGQFVTGKCGSCGIETWPCNDCGAQIPKGIELCPSCAKKIDDAERWEQLHPEARCPPRE